MMKDKSTIPFAERHPLINSLIGLVILIVLFFCGFNIVSFVIQKIVSGVGYLVKNFPKLDAVIIVAIITGGVSLLGVFINSIISKLLEYNRSRQEYLAKSAKLRMGNLLR